ncbi:alpha-ketoglutarate-dependent dioxygenase alkB homolog 4-like [Gigantopelta aegis]|uniref:alpha-ketoglutarate-dependent dioxygenase alkB homolog 4-like n=1 Tax=Gigantopelta aegis TaxID=1735272 RepID=UPI001B888977|nr:alpha-ketoglutarate-dependent dioxygenase alkB homolog 4-like [Gigantopelta aegis]
MDLLLPKNNVCACKGIRTCLSCETNKMPLLQDNIAKSGLVYRYCHHCCKAFADSDHTSHPDHKGDSVPLEGVVICEDFISSEEEDRLVSKIYETPFVDSQSGRRKQDYGPKVNFKKQKVKTEVFSGLPQFSQFIYERMTSISALARFAPVELCNLEYDASRGASIDPHFDDFWLWGERLVTVNLLSDSILCFTRDDKPDVEIHVLMPRRSLIVVAGEARYRWKHGIHRSDINGRRIAMTFRELSNEFKDGGTKEQFGKQLVDLALTFGGRAVGS